MAIEAFKFKTWKENFWKSLLDLKLEFELIVDETVDT